MNLPYTSHACSNKRRYMTTHNYELDCADRLVNSSARTWVINDDGTFSPHRWSTKRIDWQQKVSNYGAPGVAIAVPSVPPAPPLVGIEPNPGPHLHPHDTLRSDLLYAGGLLSAGALGSGLVPHFFGKRLAHQFIDFVPQPPLVGVEPNPGPPTKVLRALKRDIASMSRAKVLHQNMVRR
jgi:hypothetical protein